MIPSKTTTSSRPIRKNSFVSRLAETYRFTVAPRGLSAREFRYLAACAGLPLCANEKALAAMRNIHAGKRAFIMGNGPSLNKCDLSKLRTEITFGVNSIFLNTERMGFHPTYYIVEDAFVAEDRADQIINYRGPTAKFFGNYLRYCLKGAVDTIWMNVRFRYDNYRGFPHFSTNALRELWVGGTVSYLGMQLAFYMGCSPVYLVGFDHSYAIPKDATVSGFNITSNSNDPNHFHPDYFGKGYRWHDPQVARMEKAYLQAKQVFEKNGREILNATKGGCLEVFRRVDYDSLFGT